VRKQCPRDDARMGNMIGAASAEARLADYTRAHVRVGPDKEVGFNILKAKVAGRIKAGANPHSRGSAAHRLKGLFQGQYQADRTTRLKRQKCQQRLELGISFAAEPA